MSSGVRTEVRPGEQGPVVVKLASDPAASQRLSQEAERLERARHPGVVELLHAEDDELVLAWAGDRTLELVRPGVAEAAALLAAVASTVADLHDLGIVHGRISPEHVIVGPDGRPRLCSFGGGGARATSAEDVAEVGRLIDRLLGDGLEPEPIPDRRWARRRSAGPDRRALLAVADRATQEDPAQRPTARSLALLIADAVPGARFARPPAVATASPPAESVAEVLPPHQEGGAAPAAPIVIDPATPGWLVDHPVPDAVRLTWAAERAKVVPVPGDPPEDEGEPEPQGFLGLRIEPDEGRATPPPPPPLRERPPPRPEAAVRSRHPSAAAVAVAVMASAVGLALLVGWLHVGPPPGNDTVAARSAVVPAVRTTGPPAPAPAPAPAPVQNCPAPGGTAIDVDGDRCPEPYRIDGTTISVAGQLWSVGQAGDRISLGDWDCDGRATPGLVRPATGEVFLFPTWPEAREDLTVEPSLVRAGVVSLATPAPGRPCSGPSVRLRDGRRQPVPVTAAPR